MADETTQTEEETAWWGDLDFFADSELPSTSFDEPLEWPETLDWGGSSGAGGDLQFPGADGGESGPIFPPTSDPEPPAHEAPAPAADTQWQATGDDSDTTLPHITVLSGLGGTGSGASTARPAEQVAHERVPDSLWAGAADPVVRPVAKTMAAPALDSEQDGGGWRRRFDIRHGNAAIIALISFVSLILLGMFMSVRARDQLPDTSQTRTTSDQIQVQGTLNTVPLTVPIDTTPPTINIADLVPPAEDATTPTAGSSSGSASTATTAAPARPTPAGATGTTQPAAQPTNTTAAPQTTVAPDTTTPSVTSPPADQTTTPTSSRRTTPTFPSITSTVPDDSTPTIPSIPGFPTFPGFPN